jgi:hypothetical protein
MIGIYKITSKHTKEYYIGSSIDIEKRFKRHLSQLKYKNHSNLNLQKIYNIYGKDSLDLVILELIQNAENIKEVEQKYLDNLKPQLNINLHASGGDMISNHPDKSNIRIKQIIETRKAAKSKNMKFKRSLNAKKLYPNGPMFGRKHNVKTLQKFREQRGKKVLINNIIYNSLREAEEKTGICRKKISYSIKYNLNKNFKFLDQI